jgi:hypothetical protein
MRLVPVEQVAANIRAIDDPVLRGKVQKALHMLHRTLELYRYILSCQISVRYRIADIRAVVWCQQQQQLQQQVPLLTMRVSYRCTRSFQALGHITQLQRRQGFDGAAAPHEGGTTA